jgi:hypothetical protein
VSGWVDAERDRLAGALFGRGALGLPADKLLAIFNFEARLMGAAAERGCACNGELPEHHEAGCFAGAAGARP